jgi:hypothetical protein
MFVTIRARTGGRERTRPNSGAFDIDAVYGEPK